MVGLEQQLKWYEKTNTFDLITKLEDGSLLVTPLTLEEAMEYRRNEGKFA